ncbi:hypothetical protein ACIBI9_66675 [Nonomuraea sp. NPDC050451]|uniref:hypothetical protein n=1 Tax=Nonomuraea sp. NPDC050451 TaxID=3364364 RepID=UPI00379A5DEA
MIEPRLPADLLGARLVPAPGWPLHAVAWHMRLVPASPHLLDMLLHLPITDTTRAAADLDTPPLSSRTSGPGRIGSS